MRFLINFTSLAITETKNPIGLALNKKGMAYGFTIDADSAEQASPTLLKVEEKWRSWVSLYNQWITSPDDKKCLVKRIPNSS